VSRRAQTAASSYGAGDYGSYCLATDYDSYHRQIRMNHCGSSFC